MAENSGVLLLLAIVGFGRLTFAQNPPLLALLERRRRFGESYTDRIIADETGSLWAKHRTIGRMSRLDEYSVETLPASEDHGRLAGGLARKLWSFDGSGLVRFNGSGRRRGSIFGCALYNTLARGAVVLRSVSFPSGDKRLDILTRKIQQPGVPSE